MINMLLNNQTVNTKTLPFVVILYNQIKEERGVKIMNCCGLRPTRCEYSSELSNIRRTDPKIGFKAQFLENGKL